MKSINKTPLFSDVAMELLSSGLHFTDIHAESGQTVRLRLSAGEWIEPKNKMGEPYMATHDMIMAFLNGIHGGDETAVLPQSAKPSWLKNLHEMGSLHPAKTLTQIVAKNEGEAVAADGLPELFSCRVRCTVLQQSMGDTIGLVMRPLRAVPSSIHSIGLPIQASKMLQASSHGLIVVTGPTGSGKSTTLAAMLNEINESRRANILTIEDPIEFIHDRKMAIINQREIGVDVLSFESGVKDALRFVPDVILIGEIRDAATMRAALRAAESGHLVITSTHAATTVGAIRKMISYLDNQADIQSLAGCLMGVIAQALIPAKKAGAGTLLAYELLNARETVVVKAIIDSVADTTGMQITALEKSVREGAVEGAMPMMRSIRDLITRQLIDPSQAFAAVVDGNDKSELRKLASAAPQRPIEAPTASVAAKWPPAPAKAQSTRQ